MRGSRFALAITLCAACTEAASQPVYRCMEGATVVFQDTGCVGRGERLELELAAPAPAPPAVQALLAAYAARAARASGTRPKAARVPRQAAQGVSYRCTSAAGHVDYLDRPCPKPRALKGRPAPPVIEQRITRREACEGRHAALDPYERDKRGAPDCPR